MFLVTVSLVLQTFSPDGEEWTRHLPQTSVQKGPQHPCPTQTSITPLDNKIAPVVKKIQTNHVLSYLQSKSVPLFKFIFSCFSLWRQRTAGCHLPNTVTIPHTLKTIINSSPQPSLLRNSNFFLTQIIKKLPQTWT